MAEPPVERADSPSCNPDTQSCEETGAEAKAEHDRFLQLAAPNAGFHPVERDRFQVEIPLERQRPKDHWPEHYAEKDERDRGIVHRVKTEEQARAHEPGGGKMSGAKPTHTGL